MARERRTSLSEEALLAEIEDQLPELFEKTQQAAKVCTELLPDWSFVAAETNVRDALSHLIPILHEETDSITRFDHWASIREHLRRAELESYQIVLEEFIARAHGILDADVVGVELEPYQALLEKLIATARGLLEGHLSGPELEPYQIVLEELIDRARRSSGDRSGAG